MGPCCHCGPPPWVDGVEGKLGLERRRTRCQEANARTTRFFAFLKSASFSDDPYEDLILWYVWVKVSRKMVYYAFNSNTSPPLFEKKYPKIKTNFKTEFRIPEFPKERILNET